MAALTLFPLQFKRQDSVPVDIDQVFSTTTDRVAYLTSPRRYAGMIVSDTEQNVCYFLNSAKTAWLPIGSLQIQHNGVNLGGPDATSHDWSGSISVTADPGDFANVNISNVSDPIYMWAEWRVYSEIESGLDKGFNIRDTGSTASYIGAVEQSTFSGFGAASTDGISSYAFTPSTVVKSLVLYNISLDVLVLPTVPTANIIQTEIIGRDGLSGNLLFRHTIPVKADGSGKYYHNECFAYAHTDSTKPIFLSFSSNESQKIIGTWTIVELSRIAVPPPPVITGVWNANDQLITFPFVIYNNGRSARNEPSITKNTGVRLDTGHSTGLNYFEVSVDTLNVDAWACGLTTSAVSLDEAPVGGGETGSYLIVKATGDIYSESGLVNPLDAPLVGNDILGIATDFDSGYVYVYVNGAYVTQITMLVPGQTYYPTAINYSNIVDPMYITIATKAGDIAYPFWITGIFNPWNI